MSRSVLAVLLALALMQWQPATAQEPVLTPMGIALVNLACLPGYVMYPVANQYKCFPLCLGCPNGYCMNNQCLCFPGTVMKYGVCGQICPNCENGLCASMTKCVCNYGFAWMNGRCRKL